MWSGRSGLNLGVWGMRALFSILNGDMQHFCAIIVPPGIAGHRKTSLYGFVTGLLGYA